VLIVPDVFEENIFRVMRDSSLYSNHRPESVSVHTSAHRQQRKKKARHAGGKADSQGSNEPYDQDNAPERCSANRENGQRPEAENATSHEVLALRDRARLSPDRSAEGNADIAFNLRANPVCERCRRFAGVPDGSGCNLEP
jgi:hypothetical protein